MHSKESKGLDTLIVSFHRSNATPWKAADFNNEELRLHPSSLLLQKHLFLDVFVKPYALQAIEGVEGIDAVLLSYQNSESAQQLSADALFGAQSFKWKAARQCF